MSGTPPLPLPNMVFLDPQMEDASQPLLLAPCPTTVPARHPTESVMPMAEFSPPRPGSCLNQHRENYKPTTIILRQKSALLTLTLPLLPYMRLSWDAILQPWLPKTQSLPPSMPPYITPNPPFTKIFPPYTLSHTLWPTSTPLYKEYMMLTLSVSISQTLLSSSKFKSSLTPSWPLFPQPPHLTFHQRSLPLDIQILLLAYLPKLKPKAW